MWEKTGAGSEPKLFMWNRGSREPGNIACIPASPIKIWDQSTLDRIGPDRTTISCFCQSSVYKQFPNPKAAWSTLPRQMGEGERIISWVVANFEKAKVLLTVRARCSNLVSLPLKHLHLMAWAPHGTSAHSHVCNVEVEINVEVETSCKAAGMSCIPVRIMHLLLCKQHLGYTEF